jgi:hypothetical protein
MEQNLLKLFEALVDSTIQSPVLLPESQENREKIIY